MGLGGKRTYIAALATVLVAFWIAGAAPVRAQESATISPGFQGFTALVLGDVCNIRSGPDTNSDLKGQVRQGTLLQVLDYQNNWAKVKYQGIEGWIAGWLIDIDLRSPGVLARITHTDVNVREGPGTEFAVKSVTQVGTVYPAEAKRGYWIRVTLPGGNAGWISEGLLQLEAPGGKPGLPSAVYEPGDLVAYPAKDSLKIGQTPVAGSTKIAELSRGEKAKVLDCQGAWLLLETSSGVRGWAYGPDARLLSAKDSSLSYSVSESSWTMGKYRSVTVTHTDVNFRSGPGTSYPVIAMLSSGDVLRVLDQTTGWTQAVSPKGVTGWVASYLTSGNPKDEPAGFSVTAVAQGKTRTLTLSGPFENAVVLAGDDGRTVTISTSSFFGAAAELPVNAYEFGLLRLAGSDLTVALQEKSSYAVKANEPGKVVLEFAPSVTSVDVRSQGNIDVLTIGTLGYAQPEVARKGDSVTFFLPGASYSGSPSLLPPASGKAQLIRSVNVSPRNEGVDVTLEIPGSIPYLLTKTTNAIEVRFGAPGLVGKTIVVDPGHEAEDPGAIGPTGLQERNVNWEIALRLVDLLKKAGANAILTRPGLYSRTEGPSGWTPQPDDYSGSLARRAAWSKGADLFISIHNNYNNDRNVAGTSTYICQKTLNASESMRFASLVQKYVTSALGTTDKGVKDSDLYVVRESSCPAVLVEMMFISNPREESYLRQPATWDKAASGIMQAVQEYFAAAR